MTPGESSPSTVLHPTILLIIMAVAMLVVTFFAGGVPFFVSSQNTKLSAISGSDASCSPWNLLNVTLQLKGWLMRSGKAYAKWHSLLCCFSGGVFLATTFLDIIPHVM